MLRWRLLCCAATAMLALAGGCARAPGPDGPQLVTDTDAPAGIRAEPRVSLSTVAEGFEFPLFSCGAPGDDALYVVEKGGRILRLDLASGDRETYLDLTGQVGTDGERGLLGLAFSPEFERDRMLYVDYTRPDGTIVVSRMREEGGRVEPASEEVLLQIAHPASNHNGGMIAFGPDEALYVAVGDGGGAGDPEGDAQNPSNLLGKLLRLQFDGGAGYSTAGNPYEDTQGTRPEIWATGLRNPWRFSFDRDTGDLWIGDVGQGAWEEVNVLRSESAPGANFGWNLFEGDHPYASGGNTDPSGYLMPLLEYGRDSGNSVTGGYVYRGPGIEALQGMYVFGDFGSGRIWAIDSTGADPTVRLLAETGRPIVSFGEGPRGELYVIELNGSILRIDERR